MPQLTRNDAPPRPGAGAGVPSASRSARPLQDAAPLHASRRPAPEEPRGAPLWLLAATALALTLLIGSWALHQAKAPPPEEMSGLSLAAGDQFVAIEYGRSGEAITWVVLRAWPEDATPAERGADARFDPAAARIRRPDGRWVAVEGTHHLYSFSNNGLFVAPIAMRESDLEAIFHGSFDSIAELEGTFSRFDPHTP